LDECLITSNKETQGDSVGREEAEGIPCRSEKLPSTEPTVRLGEAWGSLQ